MSKLARPDADRLRSAITVQLALILLVAAVLRFNRIDQPFTDAFSWRQVSVAMMAENYHNTNWNIFYPEVNWSGPGPNYQGREFQTVSYLAALLYTFTGQHDWVGRSIAIGFGLWGIFALYQLVRRVWDEEHALAAAAVMAVLPASIIVERSFLPDPAMVALVVTGLWLWLVYLQTGRPSYLLLAGFVSAWGFCTKLPGLIVGLPMAYATFAILGYRQVLRPKKIAALAFFALVTLIPVTAYYLWARHLALTYPPYHFAGDGNWLWQDGLGRWLEESYFLPRLIQLLNNWLWSAPVIGLVALTLFLRPPAAGDKATGSKAPWFFHWWLVAGGVYYLIGAQELVENPWNFHILSPAAAALAGHAILVLASAASRRLAKPVPRLVKGFLLLLILVLGYRGLQSAYYPYAEEGHELGLALRQVTQPGDFVVTIGTNFGDPVPIYYSHRRGWGFPPPDNSYAWTQLPENDDEAIQQLEKLRHSGASWLGIVNQHQQEVWQEHPVLGAHINQTCEVKQNDAGGYICQLLPPGQLRQPEPPAGTTSTADLLLSQQIRYHRPDAERVTLVWGVNGWTAVAAATQPEGTAVIDGLMYTPMFREGDTFVVTLQVRPEATIDYVFQVTGTGVDPAAEIWDTNNGQDYRSLAAGEAAIEVTAGAAANPGVVAPASHKSVLLIGLGLILACGTLFVLRTTVTSSRLQAPADARRLRYLGDLLWELVVRDMKLRYKRSVLGISWSLLNPLAQLLVFSFIFRFVLPLNIPNYTSFLFIGLLAWSWFQSSLFTAATVIVDGRSLIKRPGFPPAVLPLVTVTANFIHFVLALPVLFLFLVLSGVSLKATVLLLPLLVVLQFILTLSLAYFIATLHVFFRDTQHLVGVFLLLFFYLTPIFYEATAIPPRFQVIYRLNPMLHLIEAYRAVLVHGQLPDPDALLAVALFSAGLLYVGYRTLLQASYRFIEEL